MLMSFHVISLMLPLIDDIFAAADSRHAPLIYHDTLMMLRRHFAMMPFTPRHCFIAAIDYLFSLLDDIIFATCCFHFRCFVLMSFHACLPAMLIYAAITPIDFACAATLARFAITPVDMLATCFAYDADDFCFDRCLLRLPRFLPC